MITSESKQPRILVAIPARYSSTRLPAKLLQKLGKTTVIERVVERAELLAHQLMNANIASRAEVLVAVDDDQIASTLKHANARVMMTHPSLPSGTDRIFSAITQGQFELSEDDLVLNVQGDEPFFSIEDVTSLVTEMVQHTRVPMGTLVFRKTSWEHFLKSSVVKVVRDAQGFATYFSRAPVPWPRNLLGADGTSWIQKLTSEQKIEFWQHLGVYAFRWGALKQFAGSMKPGVLESTEGLEQLRAIEAGWNILAAVANDAPLGIDTAEDLKAAVEKVKTESET